jgi:hypothetical protein
MSRKTVELPAERLAIGMYVANLDRPWVETPFLFQGFAIREQQEISQLQQLCKVVSVDVTTPEAAEAVRRALEAARAAKASEPTRQILIERLRPQSIVRGAIP